MLNVVAVSGMPAVGKTTLFKELMSSTGALRWHWEKRGLVVFHQHSKSKAIILGDYSQEVVFGGTDRLSMAVQKSAIEFIEHVSTDNRFPAILLEGDRLYNDSFLKAVEGMNEVRLSVIELFADEETLKTRHRERKDTQTEKWLAGRATKLANVRRNRYVERRPNSTREQLLANVDYLLAKAGLLLPAAG